MRIACLAILAGCSPGHGEQGGGKSELVPAATAHVAATKALPMSPAGEGPAEPAHTPENTFYIYLTESGGWCALKSRAAFVAEVRSSNASQFEADQAQVWLAGRQPIRITEFRMDAEGEWSTTSTYELNASGNVTAVNVIVRSGEPATDTSSNFAVIRGAYNPALPAALSADVFRKATSIASFPFAQIIDRFSREKGAEKLCGQ